MYKIIQFGENEIQRYTKEDMEEVFTVHQRLWLSEGKIVELENGLTAVDLQAFYARHK